MTTAWLTQSVEHETLNLRVVGSGSTLRAKLSCGWSPPRARSWAALTRSPAETPFHVFELELGWVYFAFRVLLSSIPLTKVHLMQIRRIHWALLILCTKKHSRKGEWFKHGLTRDKQKKVSDCKHCLRLATIIFINLQFKSLLSILLYSSDFPNTE